MGPLFVYTWKWLQIKEHTFGFERVSVRGAGDTGKIARHYALKCAGGAGGVKDRAGYKRDFGQVPVHGL